MITKAILLLGGRSTKIHYGSNNGIDTIPSFILADPDTNRHDFGGNSIAFSKGDFNKDGYKDFSMQGVDLTMHLGGPRVSNYNRYGKTGLAGIYGYPDKSIPVGDQNGDSVYDFAVCKLTFLTGIDEWFGYLVIYAGRDDIHVDVDESPTPISKNFELYQNYPNPFNPTTTISYTLQPSGNITLKVFDVLGREVATLVNESKSAGRYSIQFDASSLSSGIYFYRLQDGNFIQTKEMVVAK